jgi:hypothetical protein
MIEKEKEMNTAGNVRLPPLIHLAADYFGIAFAME